MKSTSHPMDSLTLTTSTPGLLDDLREPSFDVAGVSPSSGFEPIVIDGSDASALQSAIRSHVPPEGYLLIAVNGPQGERMLKIAEVLHRSIVAIHTCEEEPIAATVVDRMLSVISDVQAVAVVHREPTSGIVNPIKAIGRIAAAKGAGFIVVANAKQRKSKVDAPIVAESTAE